MTEGKKLILDVNHSQFRSKNIWTRAKIVYMHSLLVRALLQLHLKTISLTWYIYGNLLFPSHSNISSQRLEPGVDVVNGIVGKKERS